MTYDSLLTLETPKLRLSPNHIASEDNKQLQILLQDASFLERPVLPKDTLKQESDLWRCDYESDSTDFLPVELSLLK